jgi:2-polyprenyl-3-methyl-5-hydroxy-6-metoxy-1,4-benzoquinol methylase
MNMENSTSASGSTPAATTARETLAASIQTENRRKELARSGDLAALRRMYDGHATELPSLNNPAKWDFYSGRSFDIPDPITRDRVMKTLQIIDRGSRVMDYGCGYCYLLAASLAQNWNLEYTGVDFSRAFIEKCRAMFPSIRFLVDEPDLLRGEQFDFVLALEVMEHIVPSRTLGFLQHVKRWLKPDGHLVVSVPLYEDLESLTSPCWCCGQLGNPNGHVRSYTPEMLCAELTLAGYVVRETVDVFGRASVPRRIVNFARGRKRIPANLVVKAGLA